jgi:hypothetical protein
VTYRGGGTEHLVLCNLRVIRRGDAGVHVQKLRDVLELPRHKASPPTIRQGTSHCTGIVQHELGTLDWVWQFNISGVAGAHVVTRVTMIHSCDSDCECLSTSHNGPLPLEVFPTGRSFAASWNAYVTFLVQIMLWIVTQ